MLFGGFWNKIKVLRISIKIKVFKGSPGGPAYMKLHK